MNNQKNDPDIKHKKSAQAQKEINEKNPVTMNGDSNMRKPVRGLK